MATNKQMPWTSAFRNLVISESSGKKPWATKEKTLEHRTAFAAGSPDGGDLQDVVFAFVKVVDMTPRVRHQPALNQATALPSIALAGLRNSTMPLSVASNSSTKSSL